MIFILFFVLWPTVTLFLCDLLESSPFFSFFTVASRTLYSASCHTTDPCVQPLLMAAIRSETDLRSMNNPTLSEIGVEAMPIQNAFSSFGSLVAEANRALDVSAPVMSNCPTYPSDNPGHPVNAALNGQNPENTLQRADFNRLVVRAWIRPQASKRRKRSLCNLSECNGDCDSHTAEEAASDPVQARKLIEIYEEIGFAGNFRGS